MTIRAHPRAIRAAAIPVAAALIISCRRQPDVASPAAPRTPVASAAAAPTKAPDSPQTDPDPFLDPALASARISYQKGDLAAALAQCEAVEKSPGGRLAALKAESSLFRETNYLDREMDTLSEWSRAAPGDAEPWLRLCYIYIDLGWFQEADGASAKAVALAPDNPRAQVARAAALYRSPDFRQAVPYARRAVQLAPDRPEYENLLATILLKSHDFTGAEAILRPLVAKDPSNVTNKLALASALAGLKRSGEVDQTYQEILRSDPQQVDALYGLADSAEKRGALPEATRLFETVAHREISYANVAWRLGSLYLRTGRAAEGKEMIARYKKMEAATSEYEDSLTRLRARPHDVKLRMAVARRHQEAGEIPQAIVELRRVTSERPGDPQARMLLAAALASAGRQTESREIASAVRSMPSEQPSIVRR